MANVIVPVPCRLIQARAYRMPRGGLNGRARLPAAALPTAPKRRDARARAHGRRRVPLRQDGHADPLCARRLGNLLGIYWDAPQRRANEPPHESPGQGHLGRVESTLWRVGTGFMDAHSTDREPVSTSSDGATPPLPRASCRGESAPRDRRPLRGEGRFDRTTMSAGYGRLTSPAPPPLPPSGAAQRPPERRRQDAGARSALKVRRSVGRNRHATTRRLLAHLLAHFARIRGVSRATRWTGAQNMAWSADWRALPGRPSSDS